MNQVNLSGNLVRDPEARVIKGAGGKETTVVNFTVASSRFFKKKDGTPDKETIFVDCEAWDSGAENIMNLFTKGSPILLTGSLKMETWEKEGQKRSKVKIRVNNFERLNRGPARDEDEDEEEKDVQPAGVGSQDDDIPF